ncbi:hypothetical protein [Halorarum halobium]|uniref:hypothetical protein n=1 Tax=Halorarum halobium TaxID=3075121 RepID=UPI0028AC8496|nr:hypothetical protein [Halobaculum sp. XH14]
MELVKIGSTEVEPCTEFFWDTDNQATVEVTHLVEDRFLVRASKTYRLVKQDEEGQEMWDRNLGKLNKYLANTFPSFSLSVDYCDTTSVQVLDEHDEVAELLAEAGRLQRQAQELRDRQESVSVAVRNSVSSLEAVMQQNRTRSEESFSRPRAGFSRSWRRWRRRNRPWSSGGLTVSHWPTCSSSPPIPKSSRKTGSVRQRRGTSTKSSTCIGGR